VHRRLGGTPLPSPAVQLSVLIPAYNYPHLSATLAPLLRDPATAEVIVVVDGSRDGSFETLRKTARREPRLRPFFIENRGRTGAWQFALEQAQSDVVLSIDQDVVAHDGLVSGHAGVHRRGPGRVVLGYMPTAKPPRRPGSFVIDRYADDYEVACAMWERETERILCRLWGGNVSMPREALLAVGGCDAGAGLEYSHDHELGLRLREHGLRAVFDRRLRADHRFERSVDGFLKAARQQGHDLAIIERLHPGQTAFPQWRESGPGQVLRRAALRPRGYAAVSRLGRVALTLAGRARRWSTEQRVGSLLATVQMQRGMQERAAAGQRSAKVGERAQPMAAQALAPIR
jgi:glycosyltransferase involved in cell wall biosynthesis